MALLFSINFIESKIDARIPVELNSQSHSRTCVAYNETELLFADNYGDDYSVDYTAMERCRAGFCFVNKWLVYSTVRDLCYLSVPNKAIPTLKKSILTQNKKHSVQTDIVESHNLTDEDKRLSTVTSFLKNIVDRYWDSENHVMHIKNTVVKHHTLPQSIHKSKEYVLKQWTNELTYNILEYMLKQPGLNHWKHNFKNVDDIISHLHDGNDVPIMWSDDGISYIGEYYYKYVNMKDFPNQEQSVNCPQLDLSQKKRKLQIHCVNLKKKHPWMNCSYKKLAESLCTFYSMKK